ncbi:cupin [Nocardia terpenica]|uniref:Cupin n=1 Tax=Nocardia terpenica TaxID=455432 RepID=A0A6G9Z987_9NOCA|nr:cupin [Nocardia terpenica]QIS22098.1 cupin [Nocardia terpenica]
MAYAIADADAIAASPGAHPAGSRFDRDVGQVLGVSAFGIFQIDLPPNEETVRHDHREDGVEDVYAVVRGSGSVVIDDREISVRPGQFIAVTAESARQVRAGREGLTFIAACAPPR